MHKQGNMKKLTFLLIFSLLLFTSCKKDQVDATNTQTLQSSINDMASSLTTIKQIKFNEALYILKTFGVDAEGDVAELKALGQLIDGKKVPEIMAMADAVAQKNGIEWASTAPPSLGEMNIFGNEQAKTSDNNDVKANSISILTKLMGDSGSGATSIQIIPRLVDGEGNPVHFTGAGLETTLEVYSNGEKLSTSKNLMQDNNFKGFNIKFSSLSASSISDGKIDVTVSIKTTKKTFKMSKVGIEVNSSALKMPEAPKVDSLSIEEQPIEAVDPNAPLTPATSTDNTTPSATTTSPNQPKQPSVDPKNIVNRFLNNVSSQNLKAAYETSNNPAWGSYESFSNPTSGFGAVKSVAVKNVTTTNTTPTNSTVTAQYDVTDKTGKTTTLKATFGLKNVNGDWKISSYKINP